MLAACFGKVSAISFPMFPVWLDTSSNYVIIFISVNMSETNSGHWSAEACTQPFDTVQKRTWCPKTARNQRLQFQAVWSTFFFNDHPIYYGFLVLFGIIWYYLVLLVFWTFKDILTFKNVCYWSNNPFKLLNNVCYDTYALLKVYLGWFWGWTIVYNMNHIMYLHENCNINHVKTGYMNLDHHMIYNKTLWSCFIVFLLVQEGKKWIIPNYQK